MVVQGTVPVLLRRCDMSMRSAPNNGARYAWGRKNLRLSTNYSLYLVTLATPNHPYFYVFDLSNNIRPIILYIVGHIRYCIIAKKISQFKTVCKDDSGDSATSHKQQKAKR